MRESIRSKLGNDRKEDNQGFPAEEFLIAPFSDRKFAEPLFFQQIRPIETADRTGSLDINKIFSLWNFDQFSDVSTRWMIYN
jgi:hypothetical protein